MADKEAAPGDADPLFRGEVLAERQSQWLGTVLLAPRISHTIFAAFAVVTMVAILAMLFFSSFTRKARIEGWLMPEQGAIRVFSPQPGAVMRLNVREGSRVTKGMPLATVSAEVESRAAGPTGEEVIRQLTSRRGSMAEEQERQRGLSDRQATEMSTRIAALSREESSIEREIGFQRERITIAVADVGRMNQLLEKGLVTVARRDAAEENRLEQGARLEALRRSLSAAERERRALDAELNSLPVKTQAQIASLDRDMSTLEQDVARAESQREFVITAPHDGIVTAIQATAGGNVSTAAPMLTILPAGSRLEAQLFSPSRAIGFVRPGQTVLMRYQAYPYQKFGYYEGKVTNVSRSAVNPADLAQFPSSLISPTGAGEPVYRITVMPNSQNVRAYGERLPLQPGMQLEADVLLERRRLIEWVLDPLYTLTGR